MRHALLLAACAIAAGCRPSQHEGPFRLRFAVVGPLTPLMPAEQPSSSGYAQEWVFEALLRTAADGSASGGLASRFERLDPTRIRIEIREGAKFSDGSAMAVDDIRRSLLGSNLEVREQPKGLLIESSLRMAVEPVLRQNPIYKRVGDVFLGSGPFRVALENPEHLLLRRIDPAPGKIDEVLLVGFPTPRDAFARTLAGDADLLVLPDAKQSEFFKGVDRLRLIHGPGANAVGVGMGLKRLSRAVRKAVAAALSGAELGRLVFGDQCLPFPTPAQKEGSLPRGSLDVMLIKNDLPLERMALAVTRALGAHGGDVHIIAAQEVFPLIKSQDFDLVMVRPLVWPHSSAALAWASDSPFNLFGYRNPQVDAALKAGDWARAMQALQADPTVAFICTPERLAVVDSRVKNPQVGPYGYLETLPDWEIAE